MPEDVEEENDNEEEREEKRRRIVSDFRALSYEDQIEQRIKWAAELEETENEIAGEKKIDIFRHFFRWL